MNPELLTETEHIFDNFRRLQEFETEYNFLTPEVIEGTVAMIQALESKLTPSEKPTTFDQVLETELANRLQGEMRTLTQRLTSTSYDLDTVMGLFSVTREDIDKLRPWLEQNLEKAKRTVRYLFANEGKRGIRQAVPLDVPETGRHAEALASKKIATYHLRLSELFERLTGTSQDLVRMKALPTTAPGSYFDLPTKTLLLAIPHFCRQAPDGVIEINERILLQLYGHEGMGHALQEVVTQKSTLPPFLKYYSSLTAGTQEAVAQFYERQIFEDLKQDSDAQQALGIEHRFEKLYRDAQVVAFLEQYQLRHSQYSTVVLASPEFGSDPTDPQTMQRKAEEIARFALEPTKALPYVEHHRFAFDPRGNLSWQITQELRYCARAVDKVRQIFTDAGIKYKGKGRSVFDRTLLTGYWTPAGLENMARVAVRDFQAGSTK